MYKKGDLVECTHETQGGYTQGSIYEVREYRLGYQQGFWEYGIRDEIFTVKDDFGSRTNGWRADNFKLHKRRENMSEKTDTNKYEKLLGYTEGQDSKFKNLIYVNDAFKAVISTNGARLLVERTSYEETKVLSRVLDSNGCLEYKEGVFSAKSSENEPDFDSILPTQKKLEDKAYKKVRLVIPKWLGTISPEEVKPYVSLILGATPILAIGDGYDDGIGMNAHFLKPFSGEAVDIYLKTNVHSAVVIVPSGGNVETVDWFAMVMPIKKGKKAPPQYFKPGDEIPQK
jgi:hypothetical protein